MNHPAKRQSEQSIIDREGQDLLRSLLPSHWVLREYRPDYGIDYTLEIFADGQTRGSVTTYETLGEHLFIQLKSTRCLVIKPCRIKERENIEFAVAPASGRKVAGEIDTARFQLETPELVTVERMGVGVPVLLIIADLARKKCLFVCLNDYVDKILAAKKSDFRAQGSHVIHVPDLNCIDGSEFGSTALRWYAKRPKIFAAFQRFYNQMNELSYVSQQQKPGLAKHLASRILAYDFWDDMSRWSPFKLNHDMLKSYIATGSHGLNHVDGAVLSEILAKNDEDEKLEFLNYLKANEIDQLWSSLCLLSRLYENLWREQYLPTSLGLLLTYDQSLQESVGEGLSEAQVASAGLSATDDSDPSS